MTAQVRSNPLQAIITITQRCNLHCKYCCARYSIFAESQDQPTLFWEKIIDELSRLKVLRIQYTGGEPFMRPDFLELCRRTAAGNMRFLIFSNGTLITPVIASELGKIGHCDLFRVSFDGIHGAHEKFRGDNGAAVWKGIQLLRDNGIPVAVRITIGKHNYFNFPATLNMLESKGITRVSTAFVHPPDALSKEFLNWTIPPSITAAVIRMHRNLPVQQLKQLLTSEPVAAWRRWVAWFRSGSPVTRKNQTECFVNCGAMGRSLHIANTGAVIPCPSYEHEIITNIGEVDLAEIWRKIMEPHRIRRYVLPKECASCCYLSACNVGCPGKPFACLQQIIPFLPDLREWPLPEELI